MQKCPTLRSEITSFEVAVDTTLDQIFSSIWIIHLKRIDRIDSGYSCEIFRGVINHPSEVEHCSCGRIVVKVVGPLLSWRRVLSPPGTKMFSATRPEKSSNHHKNLPNRVEHLQSPPIRHDA